MNSRTGIAAATIAVVFWSIGNIIVRLVDLPGIQIAFWRISTGAAIYWVILAVSGRRLTWAYLRRSAPAGLAISLEIALFFVALKATTVANVTVIGALQPIVLLVFGIKRFGERLTIGLIGLAGVALAGVALVVFGSTVKPIWSPRGDVLAFGAMLLFALYYVTAKGARNDVPAFEFQTAVWVVGTVALLPFAIVDAGGLVVPAAEHWPGLAMLLLIPATGHLLMNWAHPRVNLSLAAVLTLGVPVLSTVGAALFLDESIVGWQVPGIAIVIGALGVAIRREARLHSGHAHEVELAVEAQT